MEKFQIYFKAKTVYFEGLMCAIYLIYLEATEVLGETTFTTTLQGVNNFLLYAFSLLILFPRLLSKFTEDKFLNKNERSCTCFKD